MTNITINDGPDGGASAPLAAPTSGGLHRHADPDDVGLDHHPHAHVHLNGKTRPILHHTHDHSAWQVEAHAAASDNFIDSDDEDA